MSEASHYVYGVWQRSPIDGDYLLSLHASEEGAKRAMAELLALPDSGYEEKDLEVDEQEVLP